ncbi:hypothetical protein J437_LFUL012705 [Ladona fulva]|uniref:Uncharacterized protein n=1 Tax=Ladona fulva TaxID=123851 RepID=A0A8K0P4Y5_LADFU|nr:hypothetical protein J437_LFUL012705 [Ladona fulva]
MHFSRERLVTSDDSSTPSKSDSTVRGKAVTRPLSVREEPAMDKKTLIEEPKKEEGTEPGTAEKAAEM